MSGFHEILVVVVIVIGIVSYSRMNATRKKGSGEKTNPLKKNRLLSGSMRLAIVLSLVWPLGFAAYQKPWQNSMLVFLGGGIAPVLAAWCVFWIIRGFKKK